MTGKTGVVGLLCCAAVATAEGNVPVDSELQASVVAGWKKVLATTYSPKTKLIYTCPPEKVNKAKDFPGGLMRWTPERAYGYGLEDCAIIGGVALSMLVDWQAVTGDLSMQAEAEELAAGVASLATAHGYRGFVARGLCVEDGKSICALTSRDQVTHFIHGLWRYYHSPLASEKSKATISGVFREVADRMHRLVTPENDYNFLQADGQPDPRGICKMRKVYPHEAARLPMVYAAAWDVTGDELYKTYYEECADEGLECTLELPKVSAEKVRALMPSYTLLQMQSSLELLAAVDAKRRARYLEAMVCPAQKAAQRALWLNGRDETWLCASGETLLAQLMVPDWTFGADQIAVMKRALTQPLLKDASSCRAVHLAAAYWRWRRVAK